MNPDTAISVLHVSKKYLIGVRKDVSLKGSLTGLIGSKTAKNHEEFWALNDVSFEIKKGEVIGIIGKNGAGKSTLLKILSQITKPTSGRVEICGRVSSLLEVGTGFHPELTGRENIYLNGTILGMTRQEVKNKFDEIVEFSGVQKFIDTPVKHYSSGMYVRLAFAVAAHLEPEILIIDEVLAVGDADFQKKCLGKMKEVAGQGRTVLFVSHNMAAVKSLCYKGILLDSGGLRSYKEIEETIRDYYKRENPLEPFKTINIENIGSLNDISMNSENNDEYVFEDNDFSISTLLEVDFKETERLHLTYHLKNSSGLLIISSNTRNAGIKLNKGKNNLNWYIDKRTLLADDYSLDVLIVKDKKNVIFKEEDVFQFRINESKRDIGDYFGKMPGVINLSFKWGNKS